MFGKSKEIEELKNLVSNLSKRITGLEESLKQKDEAPQLDLPDIEWIKEIVNNPESDKFDCLPDIQKLKIWKNIFDNIGLTSQYNVIEQYPYHLGEEFFQDIDMKMIGMIYLGQIGKGFGKAKQCRYVFDFSDFKISSDQYKSVINRVISMGVKDFNMHDYQDIYSSSDNEHKIIFGYDAEEIELNIKGGKYLDGSLVEKVVREIKDEIGPTRFYFWLHCEFGSYLLFLNNYQKTLIERLFKIPNKLKILNIENEN